jgi:hypothetical protein
MGVRVRIIEKDFATGLPTIFYKTFPDALKFDVFFDGAQESTHLKVVNEKNEMLAFFPSGGWVSAEITKERQ